MEQAEMRKRWGKSSREEPRRTEHSEKKPPNTAIKSSYTNDAMNTLNTARKADASPKLDMQLEYRVCPDISVLQDRAYCESYLPLTMEIAERSKKLLIPELYKFPRGLPYQDRVLVLIAPTFHEDVREFHRNNGPSMATIFKGHQLEHLDKDLSKRLCDLLNSLNSGELT